MIENESQSRAPTTAPGSRKWAWARRAAVLSAFFFLVKGLVWLGAGVVVAPQVF